MYLKIVGVILFLGLMAAGYIVYIVWGNDNVLKDDEFVLDKKVGIDEAIDLLKEDGFIRDSQGIRWLAGQKNIDEVHPNTYSIKSFMNNNALLNVLRQGRFETSVTIPEGNWKCEDIAESIASQLGYSDQAKDDFVNDFLSRFSSYDIDTSFESSCEYSCVTLRNDQLPNLFSSVIANTYFFNAYPTAQTVYDRLILEDSIWWSDASRQDNMKRLGLSKEQVVIIASIVEKETNYSQEKGDLAMVYINRITRRSEAAYFLQADPTTKFAIDELDLRRVTRKETDCDCPFNTYQVKYLPPAPICMPSSKTINAVLNAQNHDYFFFCADPENFDRPAIEHKHILSKTLDEHNKVANRYHAALTDFLSANN